MSKKKIILLSTVASLAIGGLFSLILLNQENNFSKTSADGSATFVLDDFSSPTVIDENTLEYEMPKMGSDTINVPFRFVGSTVMGKKVGSATDFYFYNTEPFRGMSATGISLYSSGSYYVVSYLSYNPLNLADIYAGKYQDLFCNITEEYGNQDLTVDTSTLPSLVDYRYCLCHVVSSTQDSSVSVGLLGVVTPCAEEPTSVTVGTNTGVLSSAVKTYLDEKSNHSTTIPNEVGNGAYSAYPSSYFRFHNTTSHGGVNQFLSELTTGFNLTYEADLYGMHQEMYQKKVSDATHTFSVEVASGNYGDIYEISYTDTIGYIDRSLTWPTSSINAVISSTYNGLVIPFSSSLIKDYITTNSSAYGFDRAVMVIANLTDGHTLADLKADLIVLRQSYISAGLTLVSNQDTPDTFTFSVGYDNQIFGIMVGGETNQAMVSFVIGEMEIKAFPTRTDIATKLELTTSIEKLVLFEGAGRFSWGNEHGGVAPYGATTMTIKGYDITAADMATFYASLETAGYKLISQDSGVSSSDVTYTDRSYKYNLGDMYGSYLNMYIRLLSNGQASFSYTYYNYENLLSEEVTYEYMMERLNYGDSPFVTEAVLPAEYTCKWLEGYSSPYLVKGFVFGAGSEFINSLTSIDGLIYDYITDSYRLPGDNGALRIEQFEGAVVLTRIYSEHFNFSLETYEDFNNCVDAFIDDYSLSSANAVHLAATDNVPKYFVTNKNTITYYGTEAKVDELKALLSSKLDSNTLFRYSSYLDAYVNESGVTYSFEKEKSSSSDVLYILRIKMETGVAYVDYESYNDLSLGSFELLTHYPDFIPNKDLKAFYLEGSSPTYLKLTTNQSGIVDYALVLEADGFSFMKGPDSYIKVDPSTGAAYMVGIAEEGNNKWSLTFSIAGYFYDSSYLNLEGNEALKTFFTIFGVPENFTSTTKIYNYMVNGTTQGQLTIFGGQSEISNYKTYLTSNGYTYNEGIGHYVKTSSDGNTIYGVAFMENGNLNAVQFVVQTMNYVSYSDMITALQTSSSYARNAAHLVYPVDNGQNHYFVSSNEGRNTEIMLNINYNLSAYDAAIMAHEEYQRKTSSVDVDGNSYTEYILQNGTIVVRTYEGMYHDVSLYCSYIDPAGRSIANAIDVSMGDNAVDLDGTYRYYKFVAPTDGLYTFTTSCDSDTYGALFDVNETFIEENDDGGSGNNFLIKYSLVEDQIIYIAVRMYSSGKECDAILKISIKEIPDPATVSTLTRGTNSITLGTEETYFTYTPVHTGYYRFDFSGTEPVDIVLYDEDFNEIRSSSETYYFEEELVSGNKYYIGIKIYDKYSGSDLTYSLDFDCPSVPDDESISAILGYNSFTIGDETTWFDFTPSVSGYYKITSEADADSHDTYGYLYNSFSGELITDDDSGTDGQFLFEIYLEAGITYYLGAKLYGDTGETYSYFLVISQVS